MWSGGISGGHCWRWGSYVRKGRSDKLEDLLGSVALDIRSFLVELGKLFDHDVCFSQDDFCAERGVGIV